MERPIRILMLEDRESDAELVVREIRNAGLAFATERVESREAFLDRMERFRPDVVLADYSLPQFSGLEALELARQGHPDVPVIMVTGSINEDTAVDCLKRGAADYVIKENLGRLGPALKRTLHEAEERRRRKRTEEELRESEEKYRALVDNIGIGVSLISPDMKILAMNRQMKAWFPNVDPSERPICHRAFNVPPRDEICSYCPTCKTLADGEVHEAVSETPAGGQVRNYRIVSSPLTGPTGEVLCAIEMVEDITERLRDQREREESEAALIEAQSTARIGSWKYDVARDQTRWSQEMFRLFDWHPDLGEPAWKDHRQRIHPDDWERIDAAVRGAAEEGRPYREEFRIVRRDGSVAWMETIGHAHLDASGTVTALSGTVQDITERRRAEEKIRESEEKYRLLFENAGVLISVYDADGVCRLMNQQVANLFGGEPASFIGKTFRELHPEAAEEYLGRIRQAIETGLSREYEDEVVFPPGPRRLLSRVHPVPDEKGVFRTAQIISQDVTENRRLQSQLYRAQKLEALGTLAGGIAHDFNNILAIALGYTELGLLETPGNAPQRRFLEQIFEALKRGRDVTAQILSFSRHSETERKPIDATIPVREAVKFLRASLPATIEIREAYPQAPATVLGDSSQIYQVIMNLCTNAAQSMRESGGLLRVSISHRTLGPDDVVRHPGLAPGLYVDLEVTDTGCGMDANLLEHIFDPFFTTKKAGEGSGIGLSVVHGIVQAHEGSISVYSEPGRGTTFRILLPGRVGAREEAGAEAAGPVTLRPGIRILFVDDEEGIVDLGRRILERLGCQVTACNDGREALEAFRAGPDAFDVVVTDVTMPHLTGLDLAREILSLRPAMPIVACTGYSERIRPEEAAAQGFRDVLIKPVTSGQLAAAIERALESAPEGPGPDRPPRVLVVDDDEQMRDVLRQMLEMEGCRVFLASNGRQALKISEEQAIDVLITDVFMPEMDGLEVTMTFRRRFPDVKIICLSGGGARVPGNFLDQARMLGAYQVFSKPFDRETLIAAVRAEWPARSKAPRSRRP